MPNHGARGYEVPTTIPVPESQLSGVPFVIGASPVQAAESPAPVGAPVLIRSFTEFRKKFGYSDDYANYPLCEFAFVYFVKYAQRPMIAVNMLDPATANTSQAAADVDVVAHRAALPIEAIDDTNLVVKATGSGGATLVKGTDYIVTSGDNAVYVALLPASAQYNATALNIAYKKVTPSAVTASAIVTGLESIELCATSLAMAPDMIVAPGYSHNASVAAAMAEKAAGINGMFRAIAIVDIDASSATTKAAAITAKGTAGMDDKNMVVCWPMVQCEDSVQHMSSHVCARMAKTDAARGGVPSRSPSNQDMPDVEALVQADGTPIQLTMDDANDLNDAGIVTALNFMGDFRVWGNYTADAGATDPKDRYISFVRMFVFVNNLTIRLMWERIDEPLTFRLVDGLCDEIGQRLNALVGSGHLFGARVVFSRDENPIEDLQSGLARIHLYICPPAPFQEAVYYIEYQSSYAEAAFAALAE